MVFCVLQSIPRKVYLAKNGKQLVQWPVEEIRRLRGNRVSYYDKKLEGHSSFEVSGITASQVSTNFGQISALVSILHVIFSA